MENYPHALKFVPECFMTQKMCDKTVDTYLSIIKFVPEFFMTQEMCNKAVNKCFLYLIIFLWYKTIYDINIWYKTQEMCDSVVSEDLFLIVCYPNIYV